MSQASATSATLGLDDAVELAHAWAQAVARQRDIRVLFIKGDALHSHGLRDKRVSADVDVLVDPSRFGDYLATIETAGWAERPTTFASARFTLHSRTFIKDGWPCDLDVHSYFPGFLADPQVVFDTLYSRRVEFEYAHQKCDVPDRVACALTLALHSLRGTTKQPRHQDELEQLVAHAKLTDDERADAASLALATGCATTLEAVLPRLGVQVKAPSDELTSPELRLWRERLAAGSLGSYVWIAVLRRASWRDRPTVAWRAFWPSDHDLLLKESGLPDHLWPKLRARTARFLRGMRSLLPALRVSSALRPER